MDTQPIDLKPGFYFDPIHGEIEKIEENIKAHLKAAASAANTFVMFTESPMDRGLVDSAFDADYLGYMYLVVARADHDNPNIRWAEVRVAEPGSTTFPLDPIEVAPGVTRIVPPYKIDFVKCRVIGTDLHVSFTDHAPQEAPRPSDVDGFWVRNICHKAPAYVPVHEPRGGDCDAQNRPWFRAGNRLTRGQLCKIQVVCMEKMGFVFDPIPEGQQTFSDVPVTDDFYQYIEKLASIGAIAGYRCGTT